MTFLARANETLTIFGHFDPGVADGNRVVVFDKTLSVEAFFEKVKPAFLKTPTVMKLGEASWPIRMG